MTLLRRYARYLSRARGLEHVMAVSLLREYITNTPVIVLSDELEGLTETDELRALAEAGVPKKIWDLYVAKLRTMI